MKRKYALPTIVGILFCTIAFAQPPTPPGGGGGTPSCWPPPCVPIDGGVSLLIAGGAALGASRLIKARRKRSGMA